ncbi:MAG: anthranilate phosphoribosyltransferase [Gammaproteobacteria bacterium]|jgi:anthranilate phosphoribosyltransferase|nr:anthranilate phosphoribosyltransferase [Gammaproteobacteria bacterium]RZP03100.1 MAG: anthranilate phosphoribosyltransferase [Gammaproteobacteria bacterium]|tara:strand:+ start:5467 stop:6483 length:1017 start_codon:yes stop_codon:yes gene_type:complete
MNIQEGIKQVTSNQDLEQNEMFAITTQILEGSATDAQIGAFIIALSMKGETVDEVLGAVNAMRQLSAKVTVAIPNLIDTCGTGGTGIGIFNVSTTSAFVASYCGAKVAKHGNRTATRKSGSADLLEQAGVSLSLQPDEIAKCIEEVGIGFMFAPAHHSAMKHVVGPRKEIGQKSIFNVLGPLTNPASARRQLMGVYDKKWMLPIAEVLKQLGSEHLFIVHSQDGLDEISIASPTSVVEMKQGTISEFQISPEDFGFKTSSLDGLEVSSPKQSLEIAKLALRGEHEEASAMVAMTAGAALYISDIADSLDSGVELAKDCIKEGGGIIKLNQLVEFSSKF